MKKVKEYLDKNLIPIGVSSFELKENGHYCVLGEWTYPDDWRKNSDISDIINKAPDHISVNVNNETIIVGNMSVDGVWSRYHFLQTYEYLPRVEPDEYGYYCRSTEEEIIAYIDDFYKRIKARKNEGTLKGSEK